MLKTPYLNKLHTFQNKIHFKELKQTSCLYLDKIFQYFGNLHIRGQTNTFFHLNLKMYKIKYIKRFCLDNYIKIEYIMTLT